MSNLIDVTTTEGTADSSKPVPSLIDIPSLVPLKLQDPCEPSTHSPEQVETNDPEVVISLANHTSLALDRRFLEMNRSVFDVIVNYLDFESLMAFSQVNKQARMAVSKSTKLDPILHLERPMRVGSSMGTQAGNRLHTALSIMSKIYPVIRDPKKYWDGNNDLLQTSLVGKAFQIVKIIEFNDEDNRFKLFIDHMKLDMIDQIETDIANNVPLKTALLSAEQWVSWSQDFDFRKRVFDLILKPLMVKLKIDDVIVFSDDSEVGKKISFRKLQNVCQSLCANLLTIRYLAFNDIPDDWSLMFWTHAIDKSLMKVDTFLRTLFSEDSPLVPESVYVESVPKVIDALVVIYDNKLLNEKFELKPLIETKIVDPMLDHFVIRQSNYIRKQALERAKGWRETVYKRETETEDVLWKNVPKRQDKNNFMSSFKWAFKSTEDDNLEEADKVYGRKENLPQTEFEAQSASLMSKLRGMDHLISMEFAIEILELCRSGINKLKQLNRASASECENLFVVFIDVVGQQHTKIAFEKAIKILNSYDPKRYGRLMVTISEENASDSTAVEPLAVFTELINIGDLIQQMGQVFFDQELVQTRIVRPSDFCAVSVRAKRNFEQMLDDMIAEGLSRGIDVLIDQVEFILVTEQLGSDYLPPPTNDILIGATKASQEVISLVGSHLNMLRECTEKDLFDVFQQEVGIRLYHAIGKHIKRQTISVDGAVILIADVNAYYSFIATLKQTVLLPYYETLKRITQLFLIDGREYKQIAQVISDSSRYDGLLTIEDVVEFVKCREDWPRIKLKVEKVLYGLFVCTIC